MGETTATMKYAKVIVDIAHENVDKLFTYRLPFPAKVGQHILVPFGKGNRAIEAFILEIVDVPETDVPIKDALRSIEDYPVFDESQVALAYRMKKMYHCTTAQALRLMIPAQMRGMRVKDKKVRTVRVNKSVDIANVLSTFLTKSGKVRSEKQYAVLSFLHENDIEICVSDLNELIPNASSVLKKLADNGYIIVDEKTIYRRPNIQSKPDSALMLTDEQADALAQINGAEDSSVILLHGVTGSGKTEVYLQAIEHAISCGKGAIVLVPEISLTPQTVGRFKSRFGDNVAVLHSRLSYGERFDEWRRINSGQVNVVVGARSAVFAPVKNLGIIVIDEEHESSYSSEQAPRYSATEVAKMRCAISGSKLILGSATPLITTYFYAKNGKYKLIELKNRINEMAMPTVDIVDMRIEYQNGNNGVFSQLLSDRLTECEHSGEQAILFINRRGYSNFVSCRVCGHVFKCHDCDVSMTYHKFDDLMLCHYCGKTEQIPKNCPECGRPYIKYMGIGTQQVEEALAQQFPNLTSIRMDTDSTRGKDSHNTLLSAFANREAQVLIGTQMIAKGLDFPNVTLVGIVSADSLLNIPDYRNTERAFELLTQAAGRAGRADKPGSVVIQTQTPEHPIIEFAAKHDYAAFYDYTIKERFASLYPPYSLFVRILFSSENEDIVVADSIKCAKEVYERLVSTLSTVGSTAKEILFLYAMPAPIRKIQNKYRHQVLIKLARTRNTSALVRQVYEYANETEFATPYLLEINPNQIL